MRSSPANQLITGSIKGLSVVSCIYAPEKRSSTQSQVQVLRFFYVFFHVFLTGVCLSWVLGSDLGFCIYFFLIVVSLVFNTRAVDGVERFISKMTHYA